MYRSAARTLLSKVKKVNYSAAPLSTFAELQPKEHVIQLADSVCSLNLVETTQLVNLLQKRLNINPMAAAFSAAPVGISAGQASSSDSASIAAQEEPKAAEKTEFKLTLQKFDPATKAKVIREIKLILPQLNLVEAKNFVEGAPKMIKEKLKKEEAEKIKKTLEELGATVSME